MALEIWISGPYGAPGEIGLSGVRQPQHPAHEVSVRDGGRWLNPDQHERPTAIAVPTLGEHFDPEARDRLGRPGAMRCTPDNAGIAAAISELRAVWGADLPVKDRTRRLSPDALRAALAALGWSARQLAAATGRAESAGTDWLAGRRAVPADVAAWLESARDWITANPPPRR